MLALAALAFSSFTSSSPVCASSCCPVHTGLTATLASEEHASLLCHSTLNKISCTGKQLLHPLLPSLCGKNEMMINSQILQELGRKEISGKCFLPKYTHLEANKSAIIQFLMLNEAYSLVLLSFLDCMTQKSVALKSA